jgi:hypothetical protein
MTPELQKIIPTLPEQSDDRFVQSLIDTFKEVEKCVDQLRSQKDQAYSERNSLLVLICKMAIALGWTVERWLDEEDDDEWQNIVAVDLPTGQASWHIHTSELPQFEWIDLTVSRWDRHTSEEKYQRVSAVSVGNCCPWIIPEQRSPNSGALGRN